MQRSVGSIRMTRAGTRFVSPAGSGRASRPLSRDHSRTTPRIPRAARAAAERDPVGTLHRSARSLSAALPSGGTAGTAKRPASIHWSTPRRALRDPHAFRAVSRPR